MRLIAVFARATSALVALAMMATVLHAQSAPLALGTVKIPAGVSANGQPLAKGTYSVRVSTDAVAAVVGQGPDAARWVEFLQAGQVKGRELATVVAPADVKAVAKRPPPASGSPLVQTLGSEYVRIWINQGGSQYLVYLAYKAH